MKREHAGNTEHALNIYIENTRPAYAERVGEFARAYAAGDDFRTVWADIVNNIISKYCKDYTAEQLAAACRYYSAIWADYLEEMRSR